MGVCSGVSVSVGVLPLTGGGVAGAGRARCDGPAPPRRGRTDITTRPATLHRHTIQHHARAQPPAGLPPESVRGRGRSRQRRAASDGSRTRTCLVGWCRLGGWMACVSHSIRCPCLTCLLRCPSTPSTPTQPPKPNPEGEQATTAGPDLRFKNALADTADESTHDPATIRPWHHHTSRPAQTTQRRDNATTIHNTKE